MAIAEENEEKKPGDEKIDEAESASVEHHEGEGDDVAESVVHVAAVEDDKLMSDIDKLMQEANLSDADSADAGEGQESSPEGAESAAGAETQQEPATSEATADSASEEHPSEPVEEAAAEVPAVAGDSEAKEEDSGELEGWDALEDMVQKEVHAAEAGGGDQVAELESEIAAQSDAKPQSGSSADAVDSAGAESEEEDAGAAEAVEPAKPAVPFLKKLPKIMLGLLSVIAVVAIGFGLHLYTVAGEFKTLRPHYVGELRQIRPIIGAEDITIDYGSGFVFFSSDDRHAVARGQAKQGAIYLMKLNSGSRRLIELTREFKKEFHPHGFSLHIDHAGRRRLFVVNHQRTGSSVEIFDLEGDRLRHVRSVTGELMHSPNDVVAVDSDRFYVTNDHGNTSAFGRTLEDYLRLARSQVLYFDGEQFAVVAEGLKYANGINVSRDGETVYVAATIDGKINVYSREAGSGALMYRYDIDLGTGVDNIEVDPQGNLWVAAHPKLLTFVQHAKDPRNLSPSQVFFIRFKGPGAYEVLEVFLDDGANISGSSVGAFYQGKLFIGSVFDKRVLVNMVPDSVLNR